MELEPAVKLALMLAHPGSFAGPNTATVLGNEVKRLHEIVERVEALIPAWRTEVSGLDSDVGFCVTDLEAALKGGE